MRVLVWSSSKVSMYGKGGDPTRYSTLVRAQEDGSISSEIEVTDCEHAYNILQAIYNETDVDLCWRVMEKHYG